MSDLVSARIAEAFPTEPLVTDDIPRRFERVGDGHYRMTVDFGGITFEVDRLRRDRHQLNGELVVRCDLPGARTYNGTLSLADFNLSSASVRSRHAKILEVRSEAKAVHWDSLLEEFCQRTLQAERAGQPATQLREYPKPAADDDFDVAGVRLLKRHPVILFGDGGGAKSYTALYLAGRLEQRGTRVAYFDWEFSGEDHRDRLERLFGADDMPAIWYVRCDRALVYEADRLRRIVKEHDIGYGIFDSIAFACDGPPESAEIASAYFRAVRQIGIGSLHIAHTTKGDHSDRKPFGSAFWHNGARRTWYVKPSEDAGSSLTIGLFDKKRNIGPPRPAVGFLINFDAERTIYTPVNVADVQDLSTSLPLWQRMKQSVANRPMTLALLSEELDANVDSIDRTVRRKDRVFARTDGSDGVARIALLERRSS